jgi:DNA modification methylase
MSGLADSNPDKRPFVADRDFTLYVGDVREVLPRLESGSVDCVVTSPPYWGLRDYNATGQIGLEASPEQFVTELVAVFREVRRVLAPHGTCWINLGDSYNSSSQNNHGKGGEFEHRHLAPPEGWAGHRPFVPGLKAKDLVGIPWRVAFALQADGWYLRSDIVWSKPNPMPESVTDRPTKSHEYVFLLTKQPRYFFDQEAVREPAAWERWGDQTNGKHEGSGSAASWIKPQSREALRARSNKPGWSGNPNVHGETGHPLPGAWTEAGGGRNVRSVWEIATQPYPEAHFATFPEALPERCIKAGCPERVCATCGKPSERIVETDGSRWAERVANGEPPRHGVSGVKPSYSVGTNPRQVTGWSDCGHGNWRPGVTLDPFMGSGTVALVARRLGRRSVGVELNQGYAELAARRLQQLSLLAEASV